VDTAHPPQAVPAVSYLSPYKRIRRWRGIGNKRTGKPPVGLNARVIATTVTMEWLWSKITKKAIN
jgi:hypothetical protein